MTKTKMAAADFVRIARLHCAQLFETLFDGKRADRAVVVSLAGYAIAWATYATVAKSSQDIHPDMAELVAWSRDLNLGYLKHPPLAAWLVRLWFSVVPLNDWFYYLLAMLMPTIALWMVWRLSERYLTLDKRVLGLGLLMLVPFYNFHALKFNANTVLLPTWAATTFWFLRSYESRSVLSSTLTGAGAAACMLGKYWSVFLLAGLVLAAFTDSRRVSYLRSSAPWIASIVCGILLSPHLTWLYQHHFAPIEYAVARHATPTIQSGAREAFSYLAGATAYVAAPVILVLLLARPRYRSVLEILWPSDSDRRLAAVIFWGPLLLPVIGALTGGINLTSLWSMPAWTLLPILLLSPEAVKISQISVRRILTVGLGAPVVLLLAAPVIALTVHRLGVKPPAGHVRLLAIETERAWHEVTAQPLRFVGCDLSHEVVAYAEDRPLALPAREFQGNIADAVYADAYWPRTSVIESEPNPVQLERSGMALVCLASETNWVEAGAARAARDPKSQRREIEITRKFLGIGGKPGHYVIFIIPPQP